MIYTLKYKISLRNQTNKSLVSYVNFQPYVNLLLHSCRQPYDKKSQALTLSGRHISVDPSVVGYLK